MADQKSERLRVESLFFYSSLGVTSAVAAEFLPLLKQGRLSRDARIMEKIAETISDLKPAQSLAGSARFPFAYWQNPFDHRTLSPQAKWKQIRAASHAWPAEIQSRTKLLLRRAELPDWKTIQRYLRSRGFSAFPAAARVDDPTYSFLIHTGRFPICTRWALHYQNAPHFALMLDTFHDLGHAFAIGRADYRDLFRGFSAAVLSSRRSAVLSPKFGKIYKRHFEYAYAVNEDGSAEPIGSVPFVSPTLRLEQGRLRPVASGNPFRLVEEVRPFHSVDEWKKSTSDFIRKIRRGVL